MKMILDTITDFDCDEATAIEKCNEIIDVLVNNDKMYNESKITTDEWQDTKMGYTYSLEDYQAYMNQQGWTNIPELPNLEDKE
jgi:hypothetical protein